MPGPLSPRLPRLDTWAAGSTRRSPDGLLQGFQPFEERYRVVRRPAADVVVEVDVDVLALRRPAIDLLSPHGQLLGGVAARVEVRVAVQPEVAEVAGGLLQQRP